MNNKSTAAVIAHFARLEYEFWQNNFLRFIDCENTDLAKALNGFVAPLTGKGSKLFLRFDLVEGSGVPSPLRSFFARVSLRFTAAPRLEPRGLSSTGT